MKNKLMLSLLLTSFFCSGIASASVISSGTIYEYGSYVTVDYWYFDVTDDSELVTIDVLARNYDVNGDGTVTFLDPYIHLFDDDGDLTADDLIASNDDSSSGSDGSVHGFDSYLDELLDLGSYVLAISDFGFSSAEALSGLNSTSISTYDYGDYQITWSENVFITDFSTVGTTDVPEPASIAIFGLGLLGLGAMRRRRS